MKLLQVLFGWTQKKPVVETSDSSIRWIKEYREMNGVSLFEAKRVWRNNQLNQAIADAKTVSDIKAILFELINGANR